MRQTSPTAAAGPSDSMTRPINCTTRPHVSVMRAERTRSSAEFNRLAEHGSAGFMRVAQAFQPAGSPDFPVRRADGRLESRPNSQTGMSAPREWPGSGERFSCRDSFAELIQFGFAAGVDNAGASLHETAAAGDVLGIDEAQRTRTRLARENFGFVFLQQLEVFGMQLDGDFGGVLDLFQGFPHDGFDRFGVHGHPGDDFAGGFKRESDESGFSFLDNLRHGAAEGFDDAIEHAADFVALKNELLANGVLALA